MRRADPLDLGRQRGVIGRVEGRRAGAAISAASGAALPQSGAPSKSVSGHQPGGVLAGIEACAGRIAVGVDHVAVEGGAHRGRARQQPVIEPVDMPVGVGERPAAVVQRRQHILGDMGAGMRQAETTGPSPRMTSTGVMPSIRQAPAPAVAVSPSATSAAAAARSGAR